VVKDIALEITQILKKSKVTEGKDIDIATERKLDDIIEKALKNWDG
jgi:hypothetical protein